MLNPKFVRNNIDKVKENLKNRSLDPKMVDQFLDLDKTWREKLAKVEGLRAKRNQITDQIKTSGGKSDPKLIEKAKKIKEELHSLESPLPELESAWQEALYALPNIVASDVPVGKDDTENVEMKKWGEKPKFDFKPKDHLEIGEDLDIIDVKRAAKVSGSRFGYFKGDGALLEMGLMWYVFTKLAGKGFIPIIPPVITKKEVERGLGYTENGGWEQAYLFKKDDLVFVSSSEHSVIPMHQGEVLRERDLPIRYVNFSTCFRREAGTYGKDTRGMFRVHQFNKVEMNIYSLPDLKVSDKECEKMLALQEEIMQELKIPYRVMKSCSGDLPFPNRRMYDLDAWFPGQDQYRETHSCSNCADFQTRRLDIKVKTKEGNQYLHALNATAITDRAVIAIIENYQQKDGSVLVPEILRGFIGKEVIE